MGGVEWVELCRMKAKISWSVRIDLTQTHPSRVAVSATNNPLKSNYLYYVTFEWHQMDTGCTGAKNRFTTIPKQDREPRNTRELISLFSFLLKNNIR